MARMQLYVFANPQTASQWTVGLVSMKSSTTFSIKDISP
jgi:hypothetical protein